MITVNDVSMNFSGQTLFKHVDLKFIPGNCYGIIGANGAGKSTFLRILSGDLEPTTGEVIIPKEERMSILKQDHFQYDAYTVLDTVILGNQHLYDIMKEKDALYEKEDFTDEDEECGCGHHHHHHHDHDADEVFTSWGLETNRTITKEKLESLLQELAHSEKYGQVP